jgi:hypothetical protein
MSQRAIGLSVLFSLLTILTFLGIAALSVPSQEPFFKEWMQSLLPQLGNMIIAVATIWYVTFTYFILKATDESRKAISEPYFSVSWITSPEPTEHVADGGDAIRSAFGQLMSSLGGRGRIPPGTARYAILELSNERQARVGFFRMEIDIEVTDQTGMIRQFRQRVKYVADNAGWAGGARQQITVADLGAVPEPITVTLTVAAATYRASDSNNDLRSYSGPSSATFRGALIVDIEPADAQPQLNDPSLKVNHV